VGGALEDEVLDEVGDAGAGRVLVAGPDPYPYAERDRPYTVDGLADDPQPIVERGDLEAWMACLRALMVRRRFERPEADAIAGPVDLDDFDGDRVAAGDDVFDLVDPLAAAELGDMDEPVDALLELDEGAEVGRLDHFAVMMSPTSMSLVIEVIRSVTASPASMSGAAM